eukprot:TRINITY_DN12645_c0_g1_i1.p1 TRINITY_DN12645_c0_g1~~TRINITY_DN12645_c0_g1_i1.p1  ORF type:complete len:933 (+),score=270.90 TRINITY_DN12645_c0_g1_i1:103-2799(+)
MGPRAAFDDFHSSAADPSPSWDEGSIEGVARPCIAVCAAADGPSWLRRILRRGLPGEGQPHAAWTPHSYSQGRPATPLIPTKTLDCLSGDGPASYPAALLPCGTARKGAIQQLLAARKQPQGQQRPQRPMSAPASRRLSADARAAAAAIPPAPSQPPPPCPESTAADSTATGRRRRRAGRQRPTTALARQLRTPRKKSSVFAPPDADSVAMSPSEPSAADREAAAVSAPRTPDDECSQLERSTVDWLSAARRDPAAFAEDLAQQYPIRTPYLDKPLPLPAAESLREQLTRRLRETEQLLAQMTGEEGRELQQLKARWQEEDALRDPKGKAKKKPAGKKGQVSEDDEAEERARLAERERAVAALQQTQQRRRAVATQDRARLADQLQRCSAGCALVQSAVAAVGSVGPLGPLQYSRGLSLLARARCEQIALSGRVPSAARARRDVRGVFHATKQGMRVGLAAESVALGSASVRAVVMDLAVDDAVPERANRTTLLCPQLRVAGCAWRPHPTHGALCVILYAEGWEDCCHILRRPHVTLQELRHTLATRPDPLTYPISFVRDAGVAAAEPREHPVLCGNTALLRLRVREGVALSAAFAADAESVPAQPAESASVFLQRAEGDELELIARLPGPGDHTLALHARPRGAAAYSFIGPVLLRCVGWSPQERHLRFPEACGGFLRRRLRLCSPLYSPLRAGDPVDFEIVVPEGSCFDAEAAAVLCARQEKKEAERAALHRAVQAQRDGLALAAERSAALLGELQQRREQLQQRRQELAASKRPAKERAAEQAAIEQEAAQIAAEESAVPSPENAAAELRQLEGLLRRAAAQLRLIAKERHMLEEEGARRGPPLVELACGARRRVLHPAAAGRAGRHAARSVRCPPGQVGLYVDGCCVLTWHVAA